MRVKEGIKAGMPVVIGYIPVAIAFGILAKNSGLTVVETWGFSAILFAGASQFVGVSLIATGAGAIDIIITTFLLNFRHFIMSASLASKIKFKHRIFKPIVGFFVTDEAFSVASFSKGELNEKYMLGLQVVTYSSWVLGSVVGYYSGDILPETLQISMGIGLYALFIALVIPELKKSKQAVILLIMAGGTNALLKYTIGLPGGWNIVLTTLIVSFLGVMIFKEADDE